MFALPVNVYHVNWMWANPAIFKFDTSKAIIFDPETEVRIV